MTRSQSAASGRRRNPSRPVTMQDIANAAGVSQSTVSRVFNRAATQVPIAEATKQRILAEADRLGYRPNPLARGLRGARTMLLGVIVREITDPFFATAVEALSVEAAARGYNVVLGSAHSRADEAIALRDVLETRHCDALLLLGDMRDQPRLIEDLRTWQVPLVAVWQGTDLEGFPTVNADNRAGVDAAVQHLLDLGHTRIAFIGGRPLGDIRERRAAFVDRMEAAGLVPPDGYVAHVVNDPAGGDAAVRAMLALPQPPTAIVASTDVLATGVLHAAADVGLVVPTDLSVVGFDDIPSASYTVPALTTVRMPIRDMIVRAIELAIDLAVGADNDTVTKDLVTAHVMTPTLVVRRSTSEVR